MSTKIKGLAGWVKTSLIDYPDKISSVLFFSGCNLRCPFCYNPEIVLQTKDISDSSYQIWEFLHKRRGLIKGVVLCGGEPTLHSSLTEVIAEIRTLGYAVKLDTNGLLPDRIKDFAPDYLALDIKTTPRNYHNFYQGNRELIEKHLTESIALVKKMKEKAEIRIPCSPILINKDIIYVLQQYLEGVNTIYLQRVTINSHILNPQYYNNIDNITDNNMKLYQSILQPVVKKCIIR